MPTLPRLTLIHGDYQSQSRDCLNQLISQFQQSGNHELIRLDGANVDFTELVQACESQSLLVTHRLIVLENLHHQATKNLLKVIIPYLEELIARPSNQSYHPLILWEPVLLAPKMLKPFARASVKVFRIPATVFRFLESLMPGKQAQFIPLYQHLIKIEAPEALLIMIARQLRLLIQVSDPNFTLPSWQLNKLLHQRRAFSEEGLLSFHDAIVDLDRRAKRGKLVGTLSDELLLLLLNLT